MSSWKILHSIINTRSVDQNVWSYFALSSFPSFFLPLKVRLNKFPSFNLIHSLWLLFNTFCRALMFKRFTFNCCLLFSVFHLMMHYNKSLNCFLSLSETNVGLAWLVRPTTKMPIGKRIKEYPFNLLITYIPSTNWKTPFPRLMQIKQSTPPLPDDESYAVSCVYIGFLHLQIRTMTSISPIILLCIMGQQKHLSIFTVAYVGHRYWVSFYLITL